MPKKSNRSSVKRTLLIGVVVVVVALIAGAAATHDFSRTPRQGKPRATIHKLPVQQSANNGEKQVNTPTGNNQGTATDNHGTPASPVTSTSSQWIASESGVITVKQPLANTAIKSGVELSGSASVDKIQYRLIDNVTGVISQGFISVVNGDFAATISFQPHGTGGRLDVFSTNSSGAEINEVQVPVNF